MGIHCLKCGGTLRLANGEPCPDCVGKEISIPICDRVPTQYQGVKFDKSFLPAKMQNTYGEFMENLLEEIVNNYYTFQKNVMICSRPNSGKSIWAYNLISRLSSKGTTIPAIKDIIEARSILNSFKQDDEDIALFNKARLVILRIPTDIQPWMFDTVTYIIERRVRNNGVTIFLFGGTEEDLKLADRGNKLRYIRGSGSYNSVCIKSFS